MTRREWIQKLDLLSAGMCTCHGNTARKPGSAANLIVPEKDLQIIVVRLGRMELVWIPPGSFQAECPAEAPDGKPELRWVTFTQGFWMGRTEVTVDRFRRFIRRTGCVTDAEKATNRWTWRNPAFKQRGNQPVVWLSSGDALAYARWASVDLPTDAEWLHACRAGSTNRYYWGDELDDRFVWHRANSVEGTRPVGRKQPNPWGLFDTVGNAKEYCRADGGCFVSMGSAWTRCPEYRTRQGFAATHLIAEGVEPRLQRCDPNPQFAPYPWDDDRGFRCIRRLEPGRAPGGQVPNPHARVGKRLRRSLEEEAIPICRTLEARDRNTL